MSKEKSKPKKAGRKKKVKVDMFALPPAIMNGKLIVKVKGKVFFERTLQGKTEIHEGEIHSYDPEAGYVSIWDDTRGQFYGIDEKNVVGDIRAASESELVEPLEVIRLRQEIDRAQFTLAVLQQKMEKLFMPVQHPKIKAAEIHAAEESTVIEEEKKAS